MVCEGLEVRIEVWRAKGPTQEADRVRACVSAKGRANSEPVGARPSPIVAGHAACYRSGEGHAQISREKNKIGLTILIQSGAKILAYKKPLVMAILISSAVFLAANLPNRFLR